MPVFDFSNTTEERKACECTYTTFQSNENTASAKYPILVLDNTAKQWKYHSCGVFTNQTKRTAFEFTQEDGTVCADILRVDARFVNLLRWLGENHINVRLSGENTPDGYAVYKIREIAFGGGKKLSAEDGFLQFMMERLFASSAPSEEAVDEEQEEDGDDMKLTSIQSITDFMTCAGRTMPDNIRLWARRNLAVARSNEVSPEERRHAQRALSIMMNIQWKNNYFEAIDPKDEEWNNHGHFRCRAFHDRHALCGRGCKTGGFPASGTYVSASGKEERGAGAKRAYGSNRGSVPPGRLKRMWALL